MGKTHLIVTIIVFVILIIASTFTVIEVISTTKKKAASWKEQDIITTFDLFDWEYPSIYMPWDTYGTAYIYGSKQSNGDIYSITTYENFLIQLQETGLQYLFPNYLNIVQSPWTGRYWSVDNENSKLLLAEIPGAQYSPGEYNIPFNNAEKWNTHCIASEPQGSDEWVFLIGIYGNKPYSGDILRYNAQIEQWDKHYTPTNYILDNNYNYIVNYSCIYIGGFVIFGGSYINKNGLFQTTDVINYYSWQSNQWEILNIKLTKPMSHSYAFNINQISNRILIIGGCYELNNCYAMKQEFNCKWHPTKCDNTSIKNFVENNDIKLKMNKFTGLYYLSQEGDENAFIVNTNGNWTISYLEESQHSSKTKKIGFTIFGIFVIFIVTGFILKCSFAKCKRGQENKRLIQN